MKLLEIPVILGAAFAMLLSSQAAESDLIEPLRETARRAASEFNQIDAERKADLKKAAEFIRQRAAQGKQAELTFICTHNSRRSHLSMLWAQVAAVYYGLNNVSTYSGGTETTACNIRTVQAFRRAGVSVVQTTEGSNPIYLAQISEKRAPLKLYSKVYSDKPNPQKDFAALFSCDQASETCPVVEGAALRLPLFFKDPKASDNTPEEKATYDERSRQIAREMFYMMSQVKQAQTSAF